MDIFRKSLRPLFLLACVVSIGCQKAQPAAGKAPPPKVIVALPVQQKVTDYEEFPGSLDSIFTVQVRARAQGYLTQVKFVDGQDVEAGEVLAIVQPIYYEAQLSAASAQIKAARAQVALGEANLGLAKVTLARARASASAATALEIEQNAADVDAKEANLKLARANETAAEANLKIAQIGLSYTEIRSPIKGRISNRMVDPGNVVKTDDTVLATVVSLDPIYAYFDIDERTMLHLKRLAQASGSPGSWDAIAPAVKGQAGKEPRRTDMPARLEDAAAGVAFTAEAPAPRKSGLRVEIGLADEDGYPHAGTLDFIDNAMNRPTGTRRARAVFDNPTRFLEKGMYCRVRVPISPEHDAVLVPEKALGTDQGRKFLYVLNDDDEVFQRDVEVGSLHKGLRVILKDRDGKDVVRPDERVVIDGLQLVKSGIKVEPKPGKPDAHKGPDRVVPLAPNGAGGK